MRAQCSLVSHFNALFLQMLSNCLMRLGAKLMATALCISVDLAVEGSLGISNKYEFALPRKYTVITQGCPLYA